MNELVTYLKNQNNSNSIKRNANMNPTQSNRFATDLIKSDKLMNGLVIANKTIVKILNDIHKAILGNNEKDKKEESNNGDGAEFWNEDKEAKKVKRETKTIGLLEKIAGSTGAMKKKIGFGKLGSDTSWLGGIVKTVGLGIAGVLASALASGALVVGTASFLEGLFKAKDIIGGDITGAKGALKIIGAGISQVISNFTLGTVKSKDVYKFLDKSFQDIQKFVGVTFESVFKTLKPFLTQGMDIIDKFLTDKFGVTYLAIKQGLKLKKALDKNEKIKKILGVKDKGWLSTGISYIKHPLDNLQKSAQIAYLQSQSDEDIDKIYKQLQARNKFNKNINDWYKNKKPVMNDTSAISSSDYFNGNENLIYQEALKRHAQGNDTSGSCALGVRQVVSNAGFTPKGKGLGDAYQLKNSLEKYGFTSIGGENRTDYNSLLNLEKGQIVVFGKGRNKKAQLRGSKEVGHATITMGDGMEYSDNLKSIQKSIALAKKYDRPFTVLETPKLTDNIQMLKKSGVDAIKIPKPKISMLPKNERKDVQTIINQTNNNVTPPAIDLSLDKSDMDLKLTTELLSRVRK